MENQIINVEIRLDEMEAYIVLNPTLFKNDRGEMEHLVPDMGKIISVLKAEGVVKNIDANAIKDAIVHEQWGQKILVASGEPAERGENGKIRYMFETDQKAKPKILENGRVDYHDIGLVQYVAKDAALAVRIPAKPGKNGSTVTGNPIPAVRGEDVYIQAGPNTYFADDSDLELRASEAGSVSLNRQVVTLEKSLLLKKGVNFATGDVDFPGDIVIKGDIRSGFSVKSAGKVEVRGVVEDALIEADGDILIKGGFTGSGKGKIVSKQDVIVKFIENQVIEAKGTVHIGDTCVNAYISAEGNIEISSGNGTVVGGHIKSKKDIIVRIIGNQKHTKTVIEILGTGQFNEILKTKETAIEAKKKKIHEMKTIIGKFQLQKADSKDEDSAILDDIRECQDTLFELDSDLKKMKNDLDEFYVNGHYIGKVQVLNKAFPGTVIIAGDANTVLTKEHNRPVFKRVFDEVIDLSQKKAPTTTDHDSSE